MLFVLALYIGLPVLLAAITYLLISLKKSGYFEELQIVVLEDPLLLSDNITVFYKYCIAGKCKQVYNEVADILPEELTELFGIFYDDDDTQNMAAVGCVLGSQENQLFEENYAIQLTRWVSLVTQYYKERTNNLQGFERMVLPRVEKAIYSRLKSIGGLFPNFILARTRDQMKKFSKSKNLEPTVSVEIYNRQADRLDIFRPLDHLEEFFVPEYLISSNCHHNKSGEQKLYRGSTTESEEVSSTASQLGDEYISEKVIE